jgi:hypothetical protein
VSENLEKLMMFQSRFGLKIDRNRSDAPITTCYSLVIQTYSDGHSPIGVRRDGRIELEKRTFLKVAKPSNCEQEVEVPSGVALQCNKHAPATRHKRYFLSHQKVVILHQMIKVGANLTVLCSAFLEAATF